MRGILIFPAFFTCLWVGFSAHLYAEVRLDLRNKSYFSDRDFKRIPEFFTGKEFSGWKVYCRTNPKERGGFYFVVKVKGDLPELSTGSHWRLNWITSLDPAAQQIKVPLTHQNISDKEVFIGLTGTDWPDSSVEPIAWSLALVNAEEKIIAQTQSFLWSK